MPIMDRLRSFQTTIRRLRVLKRGDSVVIGVSGGADSLALMHLFAQSRDTLGVEPLVVHVHHGIRGDEADADAAFVSASADQMGMAHRVMRVDVPELARAHRLTLEEAARKARYTLLAQAADEIGARVIAVAHNADDQAETVIMHLLRGSGLAGLRGMLPIVELSESHLLPEARARHALPLRIVRPLLEVTRADIEAYCDANALIPRIDSTNADTAYTRNRIRHEVMPILKQVSPNVVEMIGRTGKIAAADADYLDAQVKSVLPSLITSHTQALGYETIQLDRKAWLLLPLSMQRGVIRTVIGMLGGTDGISLEHVDHAVQVALEGRHHSFAQFPHGMGVEVTITSMFFRWSHASAQMLPEEQPLVSAQLKLDTFGEFVLPASSWRVIVQIYNGMRDGAEWQALLQNQWTKPFSADQLDFPLTLEPRRHRLKFYPQGVGGSQSIKEFMSKAKVPIRLRQQLPILTHGNDVIWVCGYRVDERFIVKPETQRVWLARFEKIKEG